MDPEVIWSIASFFEKTFELLEMSGNGPNNLFIIMGFIALILWLRQLSIYNKKAKEEGVEP